MLVLNKNVDVNLYYNINSIFFFPIVMQTKLQKLVVENDRLSPLPYYDRYGRNPQRYPDEYFISNSSMLFFFLFNNILVDEHIQLKFHHYHILILQEMDPLRISGMKIK